MGDLSQSESEYQREDIEAIPDQSFNQNDEHFSDDSDSDVSERQMIQQATRDANRKKKKSGGFQSMGLSYPVFNAIMKKGYKVPTPIQRKCIPIILGNQSYGNSVSTGRDLVAMARTGSGKSAAFIIPMLEKLKSHSIQIGTRALILSPTRELTVQIAQFARDLAKFTDLRIVTITGGDSLEEQFGMIASNPDVIISTPGRLMHLILEMTNVDFLKTVEYLVFDECDRLFEMGFQQQINEILHRISPQRQTLLFSATLPKSLVEFAKAGLQNPALIRLDVEHKISPDLELIFFGLKQVYKEAALIYLINNVIDSQNEQTIVFASTKHHVEYIHELLRAHNINSAQVYGSMDQTARSININRFRTGKTNFLIVTDLAARGIDIPHLNNVIHYDFCDKAKLFIHRSGRAARAGRSGKSFAFLTNDDLAHLIDLQLFLGKTWRLGGDIEDPEDVDYKNQIIYSSIPEQLLGEQYEAICQLIQSQVSLQGLKKSSENGYNLYKNTRSQASKESHQRSRQLLELAPLGSQKLGIHPMLKSKMNQSQIEGVNILEQLRNFRPQETVFEIKKMGLNKNKNVNELASTIMRNRRVQLSETILKKKEKIQKDLVNEGSPIQANNLNGIESVDEQTITEVFGEQKQSFKKRKRNDQQTEAFKNEDYYIPYVQADQNVEREYQVTDQSSPFNKLANQYQLDITGDEDSALKRGKYQQLKWDKRQKKFVKEGQIGADNKKMMKSQSGALIPATFKSKAFDQWQKKTKYQFQQGGIEDQNVQQFKQSSNGNKRFKHHKVTAPKPLDPLNKNYEKKVKQYKKLGKPLPTNQGRKIQDEIKSRDKLIHERKIKEKRREKNARPSKKLKSNNKRRK